VCRDGFEQRVFWFDDRLVVPKDRELKNKLMDEAHLSKLSIHPKSSKMYQELRPHYWWTKMKKEIAAYVARYDMCCRVKALHVRPAGLLQSLSVPD
jgi:6-phosphogluconolactonase/glucosamine-6-phosphate isomerase/deaminase